MPDSYSTGSRPRVWVELNLHPEPFARLEAVADVTVVGACDTTGLAGADFAVIGASVVDDAFLELAGPALKMVVRHGIGYDKVQVPAATARGILAANTPSGPTEGTAEHAVALMLGVAKGVARADRVLHHAGDWDAARSRGVEMKGRTLGLVGYGRIGRRVAEICSLGLGMTVVFHDPFLPDGATLPDWIERAESLRGLLARSDVLSLHLGLSPETNRLIGAAELALLPDGAILVNTSRGELVDATALQAALASGRLFGAGLDVFEVEPSHPDNPLFRMENVVKTPHMASATTEGSFRSSSGVVRQILQVMAGDRPESLLNPSAWPGRAGAPVAGPGQ